MKVYDETILEKVYPTLELSVPIPEDIYAPANPDGSRPKARLIASTENAPLKLVLSMLSSLGEDEDQLANLGIGFSEKHMPQDQLDALDMDNSDDLIELLQYERTEWSEPFEVATASGTLEDGTEWQARIEAVAPSARAFVTAIHHLCSGPMLNRFLAALMPDEDDYYGDDE